MDDAQLNLVATGVNLHQGLFQCFHGTGDVTLDDQVQGIHLALGHGGVEGLQGDALATLSQLGVTVGCLTLLSDLAGGALFLGGEEGVTCARHGGQTQHLHGAGGAGFLHGLAVLVEHCADAAVCHTGNNGVANAQGTGLNQDGGDRTAALVQVGLDGHAAGFLVRVSGQLEHVGGQGDRLQQLVDVGAVTCGDVHEHGVATVLFGDQAVLGELATDLVRGGAFLIDLVHGHHDRHVSCLGVVQRLNGLGHHAVIRCDHEDGHVGDLRTAGTHSGERLVTGGIDEGDGAVFALDGGVDLVRTDVLGNAAGLTLDNVGVADSVQQAGLTVVDVTHDGHDRGTNLQNILALSLKLCLEVDVEGLEQLALLVLGGHNLDDVAQLGAQ